MSDRVVPVLRLAVLCEDVVNDADGQPFALNVPVHTLAWPAGGGGRFRPPTLRLYLQLSDGVGTFYLSAELRNEAGTVQYQLRPPAEVTFPGTAHRSVPLEIVVGLNDLEFPNPGLYELHVKCNHLSLHDPRAGIPVPSPPIRVSVLPAGSF
jgi:hypothetical protein